MPTQYKEENKMKIINTVTGEALAEIITNRHLL